MWSKFDDGFPDHPKVLAAGPLASWLYVCGVCYSNRLMTDGFIPLGQVRRLADVDNALGLASTLCEVGLWEKVDGGYRIHDFLEYNFSAEQAKAHKEHISEVRAEAGRKGMESRWGNKEDNKDNKPDSNLLDPLPSTVDNKTITPSRTRTRTHSHPQPDPEDSAADAARPDSKPAKPTSDDTFPYARLWALVSDEWGSLTWNWPQETKAVKAILKAHPDATPEELAAFLEYKGHTFRGDPNSMPTFSRYKADYGSWVKAGMPFVPKEQRQNNEISKRDRLIIERGLDHYAVSASGRRAVGDIRPNRVPLLLGDGSDPS